MTTNKERKWPAGTVDKINEWAESQLGISLEPWQLDIMRQFEAQKPRTLADMTRDEREACQWMQADFTETEYWHVITAVAGEKSWLLRQEDGSSFEVPNSQITPLPDLPRMVWPGEQATEEAPEVEEGIYGHALWDMFKKAIRDEKEYHIDAQDYEGVKRWRDAERALGTALETNPPKEAPDLPEPEDAPDGYYLVHWWGEEHPVPAEKVQGQWWVIGKETFLHPKDVFIVSRLVMEGWV